MGGAGGIAGSGGMAGNGEMPVDTHGDPGYFHFEAGSQSWSAAFGRDGVATVSTERFFKGKSSLKLDVDLTAADLLKPDGGGSANDARGVAWSLTPQQAVLLAGKSPPWSGKQVKVRLFFTEMPPAGYIVLVAHARDLPWSPSANLAGSIKAGEWIEVTTTPPTYTLPAAQALGLDYYLQFGLFMSGFSGPYKGTVYVDSIELM